MSRSELFRGGLSSVLLALLWVGPACSSSDAPVPGGPDSGAGGAAAGASANGGKAGKGGASGSGSGGRAGAGNAGRAGSGTAATAGAGMAGDSTGTAGNGVGSAGDGVGGAGMAGSGSEAGSGGGSTVQCEPNNDQCPAGKYCSAANTCIDGCKNADSCASGVCDADHDCQNCISDQECSEPNVCGATRCAPACDATQEGTNQGCGTGLTCCSLHCVSTVNDQQHCGACGTACAATQFCGQSGCISTQLSSLCQVGKLVVILDGQSGDDPKSRELAQSVVAHCPSGQTVREVSQTVADALNPIDGHPVAGSAELLLIAGSSYFQKGADYMVLNKLAPLVNLGSQDSFEIRDSSTNALIASELISETTDGNDLFAVQFMRDPSSGSLILNAYGFTVGGTAAAAYYFEQSIMSDLSGATKAWYVGKFTDTNANSLPDMNELTIIASGG